MIARALLLFFLLVAPGCALLHSSSSAEDTAAADKLLTRAESDLAAGKNEQALSELRDARDLSSLSSDQKNRIDLLLERCAEARIGELSKAGSDPDEMEELFDLNLPRQIAITAGVRTAKLMLDQGEPIDAYSMIKKVDTRYPPAGTHHERVLAGDILFEAGMKLAESHFSILGLFSDQDDAKAILEYLVQNYPKEQRCDQAYRRLAKLYEGDRLWSTSIERYQDLVTYHLDSPLAIEAEWRIPHLRLVSLRRPDYDRRELLRALDELNAWLEAHAGNEFEARAGADRKDCLKRLAQSDLIVAHFYTEVEQWDGARIHAERALILAGQSGDASTISKAERSMAGLPRDTQDQAPGAAPTDPAALHAPEVPSAPPPGALP